jgi:hypothetical protein
MGGIRVEADMMADQIKPGDGIIWGGGESVEYKLGDSNCGVVEKPRSGFLPRPRALTVWHHLDSPWAVLGINLGIKDI